MLILSEYADCPWRAIGKQALLVGRLLPGATANLGAFAGQTVRILIEATDASGASLVEAAVDDVRITQA